MYFSVPKGEFVLAPTTLVPSAVASAITTSIPSIAVASVTLEPSATLAIAKSVLIAAGAQSPY